MSDNHLSQFKRQIESTPVPKKLDSIIQESIQRGKKDMKKEKYKQMVIKIVTSAAAISIFFTIMVNVSPSFTETIENLPVFGDLVEILSFPKNGEDIINGNVQYIGQVSEDKGIKISADPVIVDERSLTIPFKVIVNEEYKNVQRMMFDDFSLRDKNGKTISRSTYQYMMGTSEYFAEGQNGREMNFILDIVWLDTSTPRPDEFYITSKKIDASTAVKKKSIKGNWAFYFKIDELATTESVEYIPVEEIQLGNSTYTIDTIKSSPTGVDVYINNGKEFHKEFKDYVLFLEDEEGNKYITTRGSTVEDKAVLSFTSVYYENPKELFMVFVPNYGKEKRFKVKIGELSDK